MPHDTEELVRRATSTAIDARARAYAPYSDFPMGAALVDTDGEIVDGVLVENVSLGLAMCAERVAMFSAVTQGIEPAVLALCSQRTDGELTFPCGACLQVALEVGGDDLIVVAVDPDGVSERTELSSLLTRAPQRHRPSTS